MNISEHMVTKTATLAALMAPMPGSFFLLINPSKACLFISTAMAGMCSGAVTSIAVSVSSELFGPKNFGVNHNIVVANIPIGSFLFGYIAACIYEAQERDHGVCI
ncbi:putative MFS transporter superfamily [Dioscorea sansibarensis]